MISSLLRRAALAAALGLGVTAGLARAADTPPGVPPPADVALPPQALPGGTVHEGAACDDGAPPSRHPVLSCLRPRNVVHAVQKALPPYCYGTINDYSCSSLDAECVFIFGSCRQFYGERCLKGPPASPVPGFDAKTLTYVPPGVGPPTIVPQPQPGCRCR